MREPAFPAAASVSFGVATALVDGVAAEPGAVTLRPDPAAGSSCYRLVHDAAPGAEPLSFGVRVPVRGAARWLQMGYHSWDGSGFRELPAQTGSGFGLVQLVAQSSETFVQLGFRRHDRFQHRFTLGRSSEAITLDIEVLWDRRPASVPDAPLDSEVLEATSGSRSEPLLRAWAHRVAAEGPTPRHTPPIRGWCSWYHLYANITEANLREHLAGVRRVTDEDALPLRVFQIDDGFTPEMGDWLDVRPTFPSGILALLAEIRAAGFEPGLWIAPFLVGNRSRLFAEHPEWLVVDRQTEEPLVCLRFYGEYRWHKRSEEYHLLDTTHPDAMAYLRRVLRTWVREWGCRFLKTDFMFHAAEHGPDRVRRYRNGVTRAEVYVEALDAIREEIGDSTWLGSGVPLWMSVGYVDALRIGRDVGARWDREVRAEHHFENLAARSFANHVLWEADPDCVLLRERFHHLRDDEVETLAWTAGLAGGVLMTSDDLGELGRDRRRLWSTVLALGEGVCAYPALGSREAGGLFVQWRRDLGVLHVVNPGSRRTRGRIPLDALGPTVDVKDSALPPSARLEGTDLAVTLRAHEGVLIDLGAPRPDTGLAG
jgi:hypothetical protein